ncbi:MAG TPA: DUF1045 domain-containing protein [Xanthobacteraceae bacterium]|jgi:putative phosphonate metabolism protein
MSARYALFWVPAAGSVLAQLGEHWLGREAEADRPRPQPTLPGFSAEDIVRITAEPRRYGLHATLKPPFRLAAGLSAVDLELRLASFAATQAVIRAPPLRVGRLGRFLALMLETPTAAVDALAARCVEAFDGFRTPPELDELHRRRQAGLTARQHELLRRWGYPYVMDEFRFHITLSGSLEEATAERLLHPLSAYFAPATTTALEMCEIALFAEPAPGLPFHLVRRFALGRSLRELID